MGTDHSDASPTPVPGPAPRRRRRATRLSGRRRAVARGVAAVGLVGLVGALLSATITAAEAATQRTPRGAPLDVPATAALTLAPAPTVCREPPCSPAPPTITCRISVRAPFRVNLYVWTHGDVQCTEPVASIHITVGLLRNGSSVAVREGQVAGQASLSVDALRRCSTANWQATAIATIVPPPGYYPPWGVATVTSPTVPIAHPACIVNQP